MLAQLRANREAEATETLIPTVVIQELLKAWRPKKEVEVHFHSDDVAARVKIGRDQLDSTLRHLLDNAVEVSAAGADISIEVRQAADKIVIDIRDAGGGMSADFIANQLFQPFRSTKSEGYGIGAYQARELIRAAHGDLLVLSETGQGTIMRIVLPVEHTAGSPLPLHEGKMLGSTS
jgi:signal transduction histidine kinase